MTLKDLDNGVVMADQLRTVCTAPNTEPTGRSCLTRYVVEHEPPMTDLEYRKLLLNELFESTEAIFEFMFESCLRDLRSLDPQAYPGSAHARYTLEVILSRGAAARRNHTVANDHSTLQSQVDFARESTVACYHGVASRYRLLVNYTQNLPEPLTEDIYLEIVDTVERAATTARNCMVVEGSIMTTANRQIAMSNLPASPVDQGTRHARL